MGGKAWSEEDLRNLWEAWNSEKSYKENMHMFPERTWESVRKEARYRYGAKPVRFVRPESISVKLIRQVLEKSGPLTAKAIAERIDISRNAVMELLKTYRGEKFRVVDFDINGRHRAKLWAIGPGEEAVRPIPLTRAEVRRRQRRQARERALAAGTIVRGINPFAVALGQVVAPSMPSGRIYQQDMTGESLEDRRAA